MNVVGRAGDRGRRRRASGALLAVLTSALAAAAVAAAADDFEPNDSQAKATKMQPGKTYDADIDKLDDAATQTKGDVDWYSLNAAAGQVDIAYKALQDQGSCFAAEARLMDPAGKTLGTAQPAKGETEHIKFTASADGLLYLRVQQYQIDSCNAPIPYSLSADFTAASGGGGGGGDSGIDGLKIKAKKTQKQKGKRIQVKVKIGAAEAIDAAAKGSIKLGKRTIKLSKDAAAVGAGESATLVLAVKRRATSRKVLKAIEEGKRVVADLDIAVADAEDNGRAKSFSIRLR